jgi:hypothetical protein
MEENYPKESIYKKISENFELMKFRRIRCGSENLPRTNVSKVREKDNDENEE